MLRTLQEDVSRALSVFKKQLSGTSFGLVEYKILGYTVKLYPLLSVRHDGSLAGFLKRCVRTFAAFHTNYDPVEVRMDFLSLKKRMNIKKTQVLFVASMPNYLNSYCRYYRIFDELEARKEPYSIVLPRCAQKWHTYPQLAAYKHAQIVFADDLIREEDIKQFREDTAQSISQWKQDKRAYRRLRAGGIPIYQFIATGIRQLYRHSIPYALQYKRLAARAIDNIHPRIIIGARLRRSFDLAFFDANSDALKVCIPHGLISSANEYYVDDGSYKLQHLVIVRDDVQAEIARQKIGNGACTTVVIPLARPPKHFSLSRAIKIKRAILATQPVTSRRTAKEVVRSCKSEGLQVVLKTHPSERVAKYADLGVDVIPGSRSIEEIAESTDLLITQFSTTFHQALTMGMPVITYKDQSNFLREYRARGLPHASTERNLRQLIKRVAAGEYNRNIFSLVECKNDSHRAIYKRVLIPALRRQR